MLEENKIFWWLNRYDEKIKSKLRDKIKEIKKSIEAKKKNIQNIKKWAQTFELPLFI